MKVIADTKTLLKIPLGLLISVQIFSIITDQIESDTEPTTFKEDPSNSAEPIILSKAIVASMMYFLPKVK